MLYLMNLLINLFIYKTTGEMCAHIEVTKTKSSTKHVEQVASMEATAGRPWIQGK